MKAVESRFKDELEKNPVRLSFQDGAVEELCLVEQEPDYIVNAKRGIISMFQTSMTDFSKNETLKEACISNYPPLFLLFTFKLLPNNKI